MLAACESQMGWKTGVYYAKHHYTKVLATNRIFVLNGKSIGFEEGQCQMHLRLICPHFIDDYFSKGNFPREVDVA